MVARGLLIGLVAVIVTAKLPTFENPKPYVPDENGENSQYSQLYNNSKPLGYTKTVLPHPPNADRPNPVYEVTGLEGRQIELRTQVVQRGATLCVRDNDEGPDSCSPDTINQCYAASKDTLRFEFYCMESCQSSDVDFFFRIIKSEVGADDLWCTNRETDGYPKDLIPGFPPQKKPKPPTTPPPAKEGSSDAFAILPSAISLVISLFTVICVMN